MFNSNALIQIPGKIKKNILAYFIKKLRFKHLKEVLVSSFR